MNINVLKVSALVIALFMMLSVSGCLGGDENTVSEYANTPNIETKNTSIDDIITDVNTANVNVKIANPPRDPSIFDSDLVFFRGDAVHTYDTETGAWVDYFAPIGSSTEFDGRIMATFTKRTIYHPSKNNDTWILKNESVNLTWSFALSPPTGGTIESTGTPEKMYVFVHNATDGTNNNMSLTGSNVGTYEGNTVWYNAEGTAMYNAVRSGQLDPLSS